MPLASRRRPCGNQPWRPLLLAARCSLLLLLAARCLLLAAYCLLLAAAARCYSLLLAAARCCSLLLAATHSPYARWSAGAEAAELRTTLASTNASSKATIASLEEALSAQRGQFEAFASETTAELRRLRAREAQLAAEVEGASKELAAAAAERTAALARQAGRRIMFREVDSGFRAWVELWHARSTSIAKLRQAANRLRMAEVAHAFSAMARACNEARRSMEEAERTSHTAALKQRIEEQRADVERLSETIAQREREGALKEEQILGNAKHEIAGLRAEVAALQLEVRKQADAHEAAVVGLRGEHEAAVDGLRGEIAAQAEAMAAKEAELSAARDKELAALVEAEKEGRVDLFMRQAVRHMMSRDLAVGFGAWVALWEAKTYSMGKLREIANRLDPAKRELAGAFYFWREESSEAGRAARMQELERNAGRMTLMLETRDKEIGWLKRELKALQPESTSGQFARNKLEKQKRAMERKQAKEASKS